MRLRENVRTVSALGTLLAIETAAMVTAASFASAPREALPSPDPRLELSWNAPRACPTARALEAEVAWILGEPGTTPPGTRVEADARAFERGPSDWVLTLETLQGQERGERVLEGSSCLEVARAAALVLAFTIDPGAALAQRQQREEASPLGADDGYGTPSGSTPAANAKPTPRALPARSVEAKPIVMPAVANAARPERSGKDAWTFAVQARGLGGIGLLPGVAWGVGAAATAGWGRVGLHGFGHFWFEQLEWVEGTENKGGAFELVGGGVAVSYAVVRGAVTVEPLLGLELDQLRAEGRGVDVPEQAKTTSVALLGGGVCTAALTRHVFVSAQIHAAVPSNRREFVLDDIGRVYRPGWASGRGALGVGWRF